MPRVNDGLMSRLAEREPAQPVVSHRFLEPRAARAACEAPAAPRPSPREREARLGPRRCPRQPPRRGAPAQSHLWPLRAVRLGQRWKRASARICPYRWAHGGKERWAPAREGRGTCAELALRDAARAWACTQEVTRKQSGRRMQPPHVCCSHKRTTPGPKSHRDSHATRGPREGEQKHSLTHHAERTGASTPSSTTPTCLPSCERKPSPSRSRRPARCRRRPPPTKSRWRTARR